MKKLLWLVLNEPTIMHYNQMAKRKIWLIVAALRIRQAINSGEWRLTMERERWLRLQLLWHEGFVYEQNVHTARIAEELNAGKETLIKTKNKFRKARR